MKKIDSGLLEMLSDENISSQLPENAQGRVYKLSLKEAGIENKIENVEEYNILVSGNTEVSPNADSVDINIQNLRVNGPSIDVETINIPAATTEQAGVMSAEDKSKLDEIVALKGNISPLTKEELDKILEDNGPSIFPPVGDFE